MLLMNFLLQNIIRGFLLALTLAAAKFFVSGDEPVYDSIDRERVRDFILESRK